MLYNKSAVKTKKPVTKKQKELAKKAHLFNLPKGFLKDIKKDVVDLEGNLSDTMQDLSYWIRRSVRYDDRHSFRGIRTASEVLNHKKGHCIEQAILFYSIAKGLNLPVIPCIVKNPKGYDGINIDALGIHAIMLFKERDDQYRADFTGIRPYYKNGFCFAKQKLNEREFVAFCLHDAGEDFVNHKEYSDAFLSFNLASLIDPNNYTIHVSAAETAYFMGENYYDKAEKWYKQAIKIAPDLLDPYESYADFLFHVYKDISFAKKAYIDAAKKETKDIQILRKLERKLYYLGERKLSKQIKLRRLKIQNSKELKSYFNYAERTNMEYELDLLKKEEFVFKI